jgi:hypothetical protein
MKYTSTCFQDLTFVTITHMADVEDFLIDNMYHNYGHNPQQIDEVAAINIFER